MRQQREKMRSSPQESLHVTPITSASSAAKGACRSSCALGEGRKTASPLCGACWAHRDCAEHCIAQTETARSQGILDQGAGSDSATVNIRSLCANCGRV